MRDPAFAAKVEDVVGLYMHPPAHALVLSIDEKSQLQALDRTQPGLPLKPGKCGTMTRDYKRHGTTTLFAALNILDGAVIGRCMQQHRHARSATARWTTSVCTGAALLAKAGLLDGRSATTNKLAFDWATRQPTRVLWQRKARWVVDGSFMTSSGVSAGTDMALALVERLYGRAAAEQAAKTAEYVWNDDAGSDPFALP